MAYLTENELKKKGFKHLGKNVRISEDARIYNPELISIADNTRIDDFCVISGLVSFGRNVHIAPQCLVAGGEKGITFSDFSGLAYQCQVFAQSDDYSGRTLTNPTVSADFKAEKKAPIVLGRHVIVGAGSLIFPGVTVAEGCSVGALSLVNRSTDSWGIYAGNPAKRVKEREKSLLELEQSYLSKD
ncbi:acyltransferase [Idiomarina loihiensis]|uniref:Acetyltransferase, isoleucine patch superfamily n=1 Tax=Idiomarina loihiensis (strain ATCC BAA-735 / DSM 15497 / L2-TR) TaxID=283942 RepID=Q5QUW7_IDILO|nr:acyltransferase [Idiomarina loihiensis]AAV81384.1 Acetyltransferase, isoleucine patch superfamily [Idiomarina loihiensis L2TR]AGM35411.1 acetyltransferase [Idiomarina loihiensis GSL 199]